MSIRGVSDTTGFVPAAEMTSAVRRNAAALSKGQKQAESDDKMQISQLNSVQTDDSAVVGYDEQKTDDTALLKTEEVAELSDKLNEFMDQLNTDIRFEYREKLDRLYLQVVDRRNDEVIKEFPPERMLEVLEGLHDWVGLILDKKI